jgi:hypothetical protein
MSDTKVGADAQPATREETMYIDTGSWDGFYVMRGKERVSGPYEFMDWARNAMEGKPIYQERHGWIINK